MKYGVGTDKGMVRDRNEDCHAVIDCKDKGYMVFAVADGMGGMDFGDVASKMAIEVLEKTFGGCPDTGGLDPGMNKILVDMFNGINLEIINKCVEIKSVSGMGTTLSLCVLSDGKAYVGHIGDSRVYSAGNDRIVQQTKDHSYVEELIDCGRITREQARYHPNRNIITRALGLDRDIDVDFFEFDAAAGDIIMLCTDGLTNAVEDCEILEILMNSADPGQAVQKLIDKANERGGRDNITVQLIYMEE
ncbi:MAG: Stp1/IreP family PP2C-type Ser/Thr phosphatase [Clostridia bacterium]|nr:Stp1/IreP family PP2C-type Ser/Thr phosphatase [Clostridia bacterium]